MYVWLSVSDNGKGISGEILSHVMKPFFTTKEEGRGTGLGLSMVYGFARQSCGAADIYSEIDHAATVRLYFPVSAAVESKTAKRSTEISADLPKHIGLVFVVDDRSDVAEVASIIFGQMGLTTRLAHTAADALTDTDSGTSVDLLFIDVIMPGGMNGVVLAHEAKERLPHLRALLTTG